MKAGVLGSVRDRRSVPPPLSLGDVGGGAPQQSMMLLDQLMTDFDATRIDHRVIDGDLETAYEATRQADFIRAWRDSPAVRSLFVVRSTAERVASMARGRPLPATPEVSSFRLADMPRHGDWILLGEERPHEIAFGVIGRFWAGQTTWETIDAADFLGFDRPDRAKIACNFSLRPYGLRRTLISYEARTRATDDAARRGFMRYWRALSPFIGVVMRSQLRVIDHQAAALDVRTRT